MRRGKHERWIRKMQKTIGKGLENRLAARGLKDSKDPIAVQAVCDQFAAEINEEMERQKIDFPHRWKLTVEGEHVVIGFEGMDD